MLNTHSILGTLTVAAISVLSVPAVAQDSADVETLQPKKKRVVRVVEAIPMWVDAEQLRVRDNPFAGDVVGILRMGQKVKVMETVDNWIRISSEGKPSRWVNSDFLAKNRVTWSDYQFGSLNRRPQTSPIDVDLKRIKIKTLKDMKIYAAHMKTAPNNSRIIITRHDFRAGPYYEKRAVFCGENGATHVRMLGEGYNFGMMNSDPRASQISEPVDMDSAIGDKTTALNLGIAEFTCKAKDI